MARDKIYAVDFDGTLCMKSYPEIGAPNLELIQYLKLIREMGYKVVLWTMREGDDLQEALDWCSMYGLSFDAVNDNVPEAIQHFGNNSRKVYADIYIDDHNASPKEFGFNGVFE